MLQQNNPKQAPAGPKKKNLVIIIISVVFGLVFIFGLISSKTQKNPVESQPEPTAPSSQPTIPEQSIQYEDPNAIDTLEIVSEELFCRTDSEFLFSRDFSYEGATPISDGLELSMGPSLTYVPLKTCTYKYNTNEINIAHPSGTFVSIHRQGYLERLDFEEMESELKEKLSSPDTTSILIKNVFIGEKDRGRQARGIVEVDGKAYSITLIYVLYDSQMFTVIGITPEGSEDFFNLVLGSVRLGGKSIEI